MHIETPRGLARVHLEHPTSPPAALLLLGHGAGGGVDAPDLLAARDAALAASIAVARVEQPYRVAGRRSPSPAKHLDEAWSAVATALRAESSWKTLPLISGGRSSGARVACRTVQATGAVGVLALAFPLHPPGRPERSRAAELAAVNVPVLVVNGDRDPFGMPEASGTVTVQVSPGDRHALNRDPASVAVWVGRWLETLVG